LRQNLKKTLNIGGDGASGEGSVWDDGCGRSSLF